MVWLDSIQTPGMFTEAVTLSLPPLAFATPVMLAVLTAKVARSGVMRWGRIHRDMVTRAPVKTARVVAMAGRVRRMSTPAVTPRAKANAA
jgi:hypothetical protein